MTYYDERTGNSGVVIQARKPGKVVTPGVSFRSRPVAGLAGWFEVICETRSEGLTMTQRVATFETEQGADDLARFLATKGEAAA